MGAGAADIEAGDRRAILGDAGDGADGQYRYARKMPRHRVERLRRPQPPSPVRGQAHIFDARPDSFRA